MAKYRSPLRSLGIVFIAIVSIACLALDAWYAYLHFFGKEQVVSNTVTVSNMKVARADSETGEITEDEKCFIEVNIYDNCFELKFNELYDESQSAFYSYGIQLMIKDNVDKKLSDDDVFDGTYSSTIYSENRIKNQKEYDNKETFVFRLQLFYSYFNEVMSDKNYNYLDLYEYQSFDNYETPLQSTRLQDKDEFFKIQVTTNGKNENFALSFLNYDLKTEYDSMFNQSNYLDITNLPKIGSQEKINHYEDNLFSAKYYFDRITYYRALDIYYLIESIANSTKGLAPGFKGETYLKMPDVFKIMKYNENSGKYERLGTEDAKVKLSASNIVYSRIKLTVHEGNMTKSSQSMFNKFREIQNYDSDKTQIDMTDYLTGRNIIIATLDDLDWIDTGDSGVYYFKLSDEFKNRWKQYKLSSYVKVFIDVDMLNQYGITISGSGLQPDDDFFIYEVVTSNGDVLYKGVDKYV